MTTIEWLQNIATKEEIKAIENTAKFDADLKSYKNPKEREMFLKLRMGKIAKERHAAWEAKQIKEGA